MIKVSDTLVLMIYKIIKPETLNPNGLVITFDSKLAGAIIVLVTSAFKVIHSAVTKITNVINNKTNKINEPKQSPMLSD